jgi:phenylalanyl-tRNA synthetase beta chain
MKISWNWLGRHVDVSGLSPLDIANRFTMSVAELEGIEEFGSTYSLVVAARIDAVRPHPDSDKLHIVTLNTGKGQVEVVSGAPNCVPGAIVPFAPPGVCLEGVEGKPVVTTVTLRGVESPGVVCSEAELGISGDHSGLLHFPAITPVGTSLTQMLDIHDYILEIDNKSITHRPDLWGHRGIAREVGALTNRLLKPFSLEIPEGKGHPLTVQVMCPDLCPRYTALAFDQVTLQPSPLWMKLALSLVGVRPISNVVDITNFVMLDVGNPTHAFDARTITDDTIVVRRAKPEEVLVTLDEIPRALQPDDVVIADAARGVALGGVMGGLDSEIREDTSCVVLESACFQASAIRRTSARLGLRTEASARFEKGLDHITPIQATALFARLIQELSPGCRVASPFYDVAAPFPLGRVIEVSPEFISRKLGCPMDRAWMKDMLTRLEFQVEESRDNFCIQVPTFRATRDITIPEDIVEEIGRMFGYDNIPSSPILAEVKPQPSVPTKDLQRQVRDIMVQMAYNELMTYSFDSIPQARTMGYSLEGALELANPISAEMPVMRRSLVPNLLSCVQKNAYHAETFRLFEMGRVFFPADQAGGIPRQYRHLAAVVYHRRDDLPTLVAQVKGHVETLLEALRRPVMLSVEEQESHNKPWLVPGKSLVIRVGDEFAGHISALNPVVRDRLKLKGRAALFELNLDTFLECSDRPRVFQPLPRFPSADHDLSVIVDLPVTFEQVAKVIQRKGGALLTNTQLFATFRGQPIPEGKKSLSFHLTFRHPDRTLTDEDVIPVMDGIVQELRNALGGEVRSA